MTALVIGLGGRLRSGKDAFADHLVAKHGFRKIGMSDALHEALLAIDPVVGWVPPGVAAPGGAVVDGPLRYSEAIADLGYVEAKARFPEVRRLLQKLGTEVGRNMVGENVWVNIIARKIDDSLYADEPVIVTGIRFPNEISMIRSFAGRAIWIDRPGEQAPAGAAVHASENGVQPHEFDLTVDNDGTLEDLYAKARAILGGTRR